MLMRITRTKEEGVAILRVEGGLTSAFIDALAEACDALPLEAALDLSDVCCVDAAGAAMLMELATEGVEMRSVSPYISMRMQQFAVPSMPTHTSVA